MVFPPRVLHPLPRPPAAAAAVELPVPGSMNPPAAEPRHFPPSPFSEPEPAVNRSPLQLNHLLVVKNKSWEERSGPRLWRFTPFRLPPPCHT